MIALATEVLHGHANQAPEWMAVFVPLLIGLMAGLPAWILNRKENPDD